MKLLKPFDSKYGKKLATSEIIKREYTLMQNKKDQKPHCYDPVSGRRRL